MHRYLCKRHFSHVRGNGGHDYYTELVSPGQRFRLFQSPRGRLNDRRRRPGKAECRLRASRNPVKPRLNENEVVCDDGRQRERSRSETVQGGPKRGRSAVDHCCEPWAIQVLRFYRRFAGVVGARRLTFKSSLREVEVEFGRRSGSNGTC